MAVNSLKKQGDAAIDKRHTCYEFNVNADRRYRGRAVPIILFVADSSDPAPPEPISGKNLATAPAGWCDCGQTVCIYPAG